MQHPRFGEVTEQPVALTEGEKKELAKWNAPKRQGGMNVDGFEMYPRMLYRAQENPLSGKFQAMLQRDVISADRTMVILSAEQFNTSCQMTVGNEEEYQRAKRDGWCHSPREAEAWHEAEIDRIAQEAAHRNYDDRNMSPAAQREIEAAVAESEANHVPEIKAKRTYRRRQQTAQAE